MIRVALLFIASCSFVDALDGHIDQSEHCCAAVFDVHSCLARFTEPGHCKVAECPTDTTFVCRLDDGGIADGWTGEDQ